MKAVCGTSVLVLALMATVSTAAIRQVPGEYPSIQRAIADCNDGDTVIVGPGVYYETINFSGKNITVTSTDPNDPKVVGYTIINADGDGTVVTFENGETAEAVLTGFTITGGVGTLLPWSDTNYKYFEGAGIWCSWGSPTITRNVITNNHGPFVDELRGNTWYSEYSYGGGIYAGGATVTHNIIYNNSAFGGGGIYAGGGTVANNIIYDNSAYWGGGIYIYSGILANNTIVGNDCAKDLQYGRGGNVYAYFDYYGDLVVVNNNICGATSGGGLYYLIEPRTDVIRFNNVWNNTPANYGMEDPQNYEPIYGLQADWTGRFGNISADPLFLDPWSNNFHLQPTSPCVSAGDPNFVPGRGTTDMDGDPRVFALRVDIGADEHIGYVKPLAHAGADQHVLAPQPVTLDGSGSYFSDPEGMKTYQWQQTQGAAVELSDAATAAPVFTPPAEGWYVFELVVGDGQHTSGPDKVLVVVGNEQPVADAGPDRLWSVPGFVWLDGSRSSDADPPDELRYTWTQIEGPAVVLEEPNSATPRFRCTEPGVYAFRLVAHDGFAASQPDTVKLEASEWTLAATGTMLTDYDQGYFFYPDLCGTRVVYTGGEFDHRYWDINTVDTKTGRADGFASGPVDTKPRIDGSRIVWAGGSGNGRMCTSVFLGDLITREVQALRAGTAAESYGNPVISGNKVAWVQHLGVNTQDAAAYVESPYDICGADITNPAQPVYFTIAGQVGRRSPYPYNTSNTADHDDVVDICDNIVVWEGNGDIFGADITDPDHIRVFPICTAPERQYDPAVSGRWVVWADERNDYGDIYGADISDPNHIREFDVLVGPGWQLQPDIDGATIAFVDGDDYYGDIRMGCISREYGVVLFTLPPSPSGEYFPYYGAGVEIDGSTLIWQQSYRILQASFDFAYSVAEGPVQNLTTGKRYDHIQHAIDAATDGDVIMVPEGTYDEKIRFKGKSVVVTSADAEDPAVRAATVIRGFGQNVTFADNETADCALTGFTITGGSYGLCCDGSAPAVSYCTIADNAHAGIKLWNKASPTFTRCDVTGNGLGAEMWAYSDKRVILRSSGTFRNCLIAGNRQAGLFGGNLTLESCTVADNLGFGVDCFLANVSNSIIYFNGTETASLKFERTQSAVTYSDIQGGWPGQGNIDTDPLFVRRGQWLEAAPGVAVPVTGRRSGGAKAMPGPAGAWTAGDYHLQSQGWSWDAQQRAWTWDDATSPCIDAGDPAAPIGEEQLCETGGPLSERAGPNTRLNMGAYGGTPEASLAPQAGTPQPQ